MTAMRVLNIREEHDIRVLIGRYESHETTDFMIEDGRPLLLWKERYPVGRRDRADVWVLYMPDGDVHLICGDPDDVEGALVEARHWLRLEALAADDD